MNGATSKSFMRNLSGIGNPSHKAKRRFFEAADWNKAVGMQKGKNLFADQSSLAKSTGTKMKDLPLNSIERHDEYEKRNWKHDSTTELSAKDKFIKGARDVAKGAADFAKDVIPAAITGGIAGIVAKKEGEEMVDTGKKDKKVKGNLNYTPDKATIVAMKRGCYKK